VNILHRPTVSACMRHLQRQKLANSNLVQAYIKSLIQVGSTRNKLLMFRNRSWSICGWTILSLIDDQTAQWHLTLTYNYVHS